MTYLATIYNRIMLNSSQLEQYVEYINYLIFSKFVQVFLKSYCEDQYKSINELFVLIKTQGYERITKFFSNFLERILSMEKCKGMFEIIVKFLYLALLKALMTLNSENLLSEWND